MNRVEIFDMIGRRAYLAVVPSLHNLYGAYQRYERPPASSINAQHPRSLQRFTAAHEYATMFLDTE